MNCAILHADPEIAGRLEEYIGKVPFLSLHGKYGNPLEALKDYYETKLLQKSEMRKVIVIELSYKGFS